MVEVANHPTYGAASRPLWRHSEIEPGEPYNISGKLIVGPFVRVNGSCRVIKSTRPRTLPIFGENDRNCSRSRLTALKLDNTSIAFGIN